MCRIGITAEKKSRDSRMTLSIFIFDTYSILIINFIIQEPNDYDTWFDYLRMVEQEGDSEVIRDTYERAISNIPDSTVKNDWRRLVNVSNSIKRKMRSQINVSVNDFHRICTLIASRVLWK